MLTHVHEALIQRIVPSLNRQMSLIASGESPSAGFARKITSGGSATVKFDDPDYGMHDPDASFYHSEALYPGVIIEVSYSQKRKDLPRLADEYILGSNGSIRVVVGLDVEYSGKKATLSVWRPQLLVNSAGEQELQAEQTVVNLVCKSIFPLSKTTHN